MLTRQRAATEALGRIIVRGRDWRKQRNKRRKHRVAHMESLEPRQLLVFGPFTVVSVEVNASMVDPDDLSSGPQPTSWSQQRSDIRTIEITFNRDLESSVATSDLALTNLGVDAPNDDDEAVSLTSGHISVSANVLTLSFDTYELDDGAYQLELFDSIQDAADVDLDGDHDGVAGGDFQLIGTDENGLFKFAGDFNGDSEVDDTVDLATFQYWFGQYSPPAPEYVDLDDNGGITIFDFPYFSPNIDESIAFPSNESPTGRNDSVTYDYDDSVIIIDVMANDNDLNGRETLEVIDFVDTGIDEATLTLNQDFTFTYDRTAITSSGANTETFTYTVSDGDGGTSTATVTLTPSLLPSQPIYYPVAPELRNQLTVDPDSMCSCECACGTDEVNPQDGRLHHQPGGPNTTSGPQNRGSRPTYRGPGAYGPQTIIPMNVNLGYTLTSVPITIEVSVTNGEVDSGVTVFATEGLNLETTDTVAVASYLDASSLASGVYELETTITRNYFGHSITVTHPLDQSRVFINRNESEFGSNWFLDDLDALGFGANEEVAVVRGDNTVSVFQWNDSTNEFESPPGTFSELTFSSSTQLYTLSYHTGGSSVFDDYGLLQYREDRNGNQTTYSYVDADGDSLYDEVSVITDPFGNETQYDYDSNGLLTDITDVVNGVSVYQTTYEYNANGELITITYPDPDNMGPLAAPMDEYTYDSQILGLLATHTDAEDRTTTYEYDAWGRVAAIEMPISTVEYSPVVRSMMPAEGSGTTANPEPLKLEEDIGGTFTDANENTTWFQTDDFGLLILVTDPLGNTVTMTRNSHGLVTQRVEPDPDDGGPLSYLTTLYGYDGPNLTGVQWPDLTSVSMEYESTFNLPIQYTDELGRVIKIGRDSSTGNAESRTFVVGEDDAQSSETDDITYVYTYTDGTGATSDLPWGMLLSETDPLDQETSYIYDADTESSEFGWLQSIVFEDASEIDYTYDAAGNVETISDELGRVTKFVYDDLDRLTQQTVAFGTSDAATFYFDYDQVGNLVEVTDDNSNTTSYDYDDLNRLVMITDALDNETEFEYDDNGNLTTTIDPLDREIAYTYDERNMLETIVFPNPTEVSGMPDHDAPEYAFAYDNAGNLKSITDPLDNVTDFKYDERHRLIERKDHAPDAQQPTVRPTTTFGYDDAGQLTSVTDPLSRVTQYAYDDLGRLETLTLPNPGGGSPVYEYDYDDASNLISIEDPNSLLTEFIYDSRNRLEQRKDPPPDSGSPTVRPISYFSYNDAGQLEQFTDPLGRVTEYDYDDQGRLKELTAPSPSMGVDVITTYTYDGVGNLLSVTDPESNTTSYNYDEIYRLTMVTGALDDETTYDYDVASQLTSMTDPLDRTTEYDYDELGRLIRLTPPDPDGDDQTSPDPAVVVYGYDAVNNLLAREDALGNRTSYDYDGLYRLIEITDPEDRVTTLGYDLVGNRTSLTDPEDNETTFVFDALDRLTSETNELNDTRSFEYDLVGNLTEKTDRNGRVIEYVFDDLYRLVDENWMDGMSVERTLSFTYDLAGQLLTASDPAATYTYEYDGLGRPDEITHDLAALTPDVEFTQTFDRVGNRTGLGAVIGGSTEDFYTKFYYDDLYRMTKITQGVSGSGFIETPKEIDLEYDLAGQLQQITRNVDPNLGGWQEVAITEFDYDLAGRLTDMTHTHDTTTIADYDWAYDAANRITQFDSDFPGSTYDDSVAYTYDDAGQLTAADYSTQTDESYSYDDNGNREAANGDTYTTGDNNQLTNDDTYTYTYDNEGNRLTKEHDTTGEVTEYEWDYRNRLVKITELDSYESPTKIIEYTYDVFDRRIVKEIDSDGDSTVDETAIYVYDGPHIVLEFDGSAAADMTHRYVHGPVIDQILADEQVDGAGDDGDVIWPLTDNLGTVRDIVDDDGGVVNHLEYDAFGNIVSEANSAVDHLFAYTGRERDVESDLYYYRARYYDPGVGRFVSEDPIGFAAEDANLNRYVGNSPLNFTDPTGLHWLSKLGFLVRDGKLVYSRTGAIVVSRNLKHAGKWVTLSKLQKCGAKIDPLRVARLTKKFGVKFRIYFDNFGLPDLRRFAEATVDGLTNLTGSSSGDARKAWAALKKILSEAEYNKLWARRSELRFHHVSDTEMILVDADLHTAFAHTGAAAVLRLSRRALLAGVVYTLFAPEVAEAREQCLKDPASMRDVSDRDIWMMGGRDVLRYLLDSPIPYVPSLVDTFFTPSKEKNR